MSELGFANPADKKSGATYSALVGATIVFDFWKIIIRGLAILGWIQLLSSARSEAKAPKKQKAKSERREEEAWREEAARGQASGDIR